MSNHELVIFGDTYIINDVHLIFDSLLGMVFVFFPSADVAADAMDKFKSSTVDSRHLFVRVLPNIHVSIMKNFTECYQN